MEPLSEYRTQSLLFNKKKKIAKSFEDQERILDNCLEKDGVAVSLQQKVYFRKTQKNIIFYYKEKPKTGKKNHKKESQLFIIFVFWYFIDRKNDPAAGSPTATLLRLLLPLLKKCR